MVLETSEASPVERAFAMLHNKVEPTPVMVEWRDDFQSEGNPKQFEHRLDYLFLTLRKMAGNVRHEERSISNRTFGELSLLPCLGWATTSSEFERIDLVFDLTQPRRTPGLPLSIPTAPTTLPSVVSLRQLITRDRDQKVRKPNPPALGDWFGLAYALAINLGNLPTVGRVHKEFRSHNVLFLDSDVDKSDAPQVRTAHEDHSISSQSFLSVYEEPYGRRKVSEPAVCDTLLPPLDVHTMSRA